MTSEWKRTMKLMWGHNGKFRWICGCSLIFLGFFLVLAYWGEWFFFDGRDSAYMRNRTSSYTTGGFSAMCFLFYSIYGSGKTILSNMGKWLCGSKLAKSVAVKGVLFNRVIIFLVVFVPCLISRICLVGMGYREYARVEVFLIVWGAGYLVSAISTCSKAMFIAVWIMYMITISWDRAWIFTKWIHVPVWAAVLIFLVCVVVGTLLEKHILEQSYRSRRPGIPAVMQTNSGGNR